MNKGPIKIFIKELYYDLETLSILNDAERLKETLPIAGKILSDIRSFRSTNEALKECFPDDQDDEILKIESSFKNGTMPSNQELRALKYDLCLERLYSTTLNGIHLLKKKIKSPLQKNIEICLPILIVAIFAAYWSFKNYTPAHGGLHEDYYIGVNFDKYSGSGFSKTINFDTVAEMAPLLTQSENITIRWQGYILVPQDNNYTFDFIVDDGAKLFIDDNNIIDRWGVHCSEEFSNSVFLKKGPHKIRLDYVNYAGAGVIKLYWKPDGKSKVIIPVQYLRQSDTN